MTKKHILLVDDEVDFAQTIAMRLELRGYEVTVVNNSEEALDKVKEKPELILLDVMMPVMDGYEICRRIRKDIETKSIPIIMLTAKSMSKDRVEGLQIGADDYITKSADMEELFARIDALLRRGGLFEEMSEDKAALMDELKRIISERSMEIFFQPIYRLSPLRLFSYEALVRGTRNISHDDSVKIFQRALRSSAFFSPAKLFAYEILTHGPKGSLLEDPTKLFQCALSYGVFFELEMACRQKALAKIGGAINKRLFAFNCSPYLIESGKIEELVSLHPNPGQIIFEITERSEIKNFPAYCRTLNALRKRGFKIAVDDVGSGYSSLGSIAEIEPDYAKIDIALIQGINANLKKQNLVKTILSFCQKNKIKVIAEGVESESELATLVELRVESAQGYFLGRPSQELLKE